MNRRTAALAIPALTLLAAACGTPHRAAHSDLIPVGGTPDGYPPVSAAAAMAYLGRHPVPPRPGLTAGVALRVSVADLPYVVPVGSTGAVVTITLATVTGQATLTCGSLLMNQACRVRDAGKLANLPGTYMYFRSDGHLVWPSDISLITFQAVRVPAVHS